MSILEPQDYGLLALSNSVISLFVIFIGLGLRQAFSIEYFHCDTTKRKIMLNNMIVLYLIIALPPLIFACCYPSLVNHIVFLNSASIAFVLLSVAYSFLYFFVEIFYMVLTCRSQIVTLTIIQTVTALVIIGLNLLFLCWFRWGATGLIAGQTIGFLIIFVIALKAYFQESCHLYFEFKQFLSLCGTYIKMGLPFVPGMLFSWILASSDRWLLARYGSLHDTGIYALASIFGQLFHMVVVLPVVTAYIPYTLKKFSDNKHDILSVEHWNHRNMVYSMISLSIIVTLGYLACKPLLFLFLPLRYQPAIQYIWLIVIGYIFVLGEQFASIFVIYNKRIYFQSASFIVPALISIILNILLIPYFNIFGCIIATLIAYIVLFCIKLIYNLRLQKKVRAQQALTIPDETHNQSA